MSSSRAILETFWGCVNVCTQWSMVVVISSKTTHTKDFILTNYMRRIRRPIENRIGKIVCVCVCMLAFWFWLFIRCVLFRKQIHFWVIATTDWKLYLFVGHNKCRRRLKHIFSYFVMIFNFEITMSMNWIFDDGLFNRIKNTRNFKA